MIDPARAHLEANVDALGIGGLSILALRAAAPRGRCVAAPDGTRAIELDGRLLDGPVQPRAIEELVCELEKNGEDVIVLFGLGVGNIARALRERTRAQIVVFEPDPGVLRTSLEAGPCDLGGIPVVCDLNDLKAVWARHARTNPAATTVQTPGYTDAFPAAAREVADTVKALLADEQCVENTRRVRFTQWIDNMLANLPLVEGKVPCHALEGRLAGVPAFVIGAGPSLDKNAELIREAAKRGIVIAANSSASALAARGIAPHVVACIESIDLSKKLAALPFIDEVARAFSLASHPNNLRTGNGPLLPLVERIGAFEGLSDLLRGPGAEVGGSVSTVAFWLARALGCSPIVLVGQDLAFTGNGTYARGTSYEESTITLSPETGAIEFRWSEETKKAHGTTCGALPDGAELVMVDAWGGEGLVPSGVVFSSFRAWFEVAAAVFAVVQPELELVNATEGGARIKGFAEERLADVLARLPVRERSPADLLRDARGAAEPVSRAEIGAWTERNASTARVAGRAAKRVATCAELALAKLDAGSPEGVTRAFRVLERAEAYLKRATRAQPLIEGLAYADVQSRAEPTARASADDAEDAARRGLCEEIAIARALARAAHKLERALRAANRHHTNHERNERHVHRHADERRVSPGAGEPRT